MRSPFVAIVGLAALSCVPAEGAPPDRPTMNPPPPPKVDPPPPKMLNGEHPEHGWIYRSNEGCFVNLPFPEPPKSVVPPPTKKVDCPDFMKDDSWKECVGGSVYRDAEGICTCGVFGNPPPQPRTVTCPKHPG